MEKEKRMQAFKQSSRGNNKTNATEKATGNRPKLILGNPYITRDEMTKGPSNPCLRALKSPSERWRGI